MPETASRFKVVPVPGRTPGQCAICHSVSRGPFVDTGIDDQWTGTLYLCFGCIGDMTNDMGLVLTEKDAVEPEPETESEAFARGWRAAVSSITEDLNGLADHYAVHPINPEPDDPFTLTVPGFEILSSDPEGQEGSGVGTDGVAVEDSSPVKRKGSNSVSGDSSDGQLRL